MYWDETKHAILEAIEKSKKWRNSWFMEFKNKGDEQEYWNEVEATGFKCAYIGKKIITAYEKGDYETALELAEKCGYLEHQFGDWPTWGPVIQKLRG